MIQLISENEVVSISQWKEITKSYRYEMKPTKNQEVKLNDTLSICRHLYNDSLAERKKGYENGGWNVQYNDQQNYLPILRNKNDETGKHLQKVYQQALQNVLKRVDIAYQNFFRRVKNNKENGSTRNSNIENDNSYKKPGFPRFKGYGRYDSFTFPQYGNGCDIRGTNSDIIRLSKIGEIKFVKHREIGEVKDSSKDSSKNSRGNSKRNKVIIPYQIKTVTIKKDVDKWFISFAIETFSEIEIPISNNNDNNREIKNIKTIEELNQKCVGVDMGLSNLIMLSTRQKLNNNPKYLRESEKKLAKEQRRLSRKQKYEKIIEINKKISKGEKIDKEIEEKKIKVNSKNREKQIIKVQKAHRKIRNQRKNFSHEVSRTLVDNFDLTVFEKLNIQQMMSNHRYAKSIADASWYQIQKFTEYKAEWAGKIVDFVVAKDSTKECSKCGKINYIPVWKRVMECSCGNIEDRDIDASFVIRDRSTIYQDLKKKVLEKIGKVKNVFTPGIGGGACLSSLNRDVMMQEAPAFRRE